MTPLHLRHKRVLAIDPGSRGFGYAVFEGPERLVDYGLKEIRRDKERATLRKVNELIRLYRPSQLVTEDCTAPGCRRGPRVRQLIARILAVAEDQRLRTRSVPMRTVRRVFGYGVLATKHQIAAVLADRFPELKHLLPPKRKAWMSEDSRQCLFDAAALGIAYFGSRGSRARPIPDAPQ